MGKNILIGLLGFGLIMFAWLAVRNSQPPKCAELYDSRSGYICVVNIGEPTQSDYKAAADGMEAASYTLSQ